jgi:hypothetical protein
MRAAALILLFTPISFHAEETCSLGGIVVNSATKEPVSRAVVYARAQVSGVQRAPGASAITDASGRFALAGLPPGHYNITAERSGYITANYGALRPGRAGMPLALEAGKDVQDLILPMAPFGVIAGRVLDEEGEPAVGIPVQVLTIGYQNGRKQFLRSTTANTNDLGEYRAYGLAPGKYYVSAAGVGSLYANITAEKAANEEYVPVYYPRVIDPLAASPLTVAPGAQLRDIDLRLLKARTVSVRGHVRMEGLDAATRASVTLWPRGGMVPNSTRTSGVSADGTFDIHAVTPGAYILKASANQRGKTIIVNVPVNVGNTDVDGVDTVIRGFTAVEGRLRIEDASDPLWTQWKISLQPFDSGGLIYVNMSGTKLTETGAFRIEDVGNERYSVMISGMPPSLYVASIRSGSIDVLAHGLETGGGAVAPLEIVVRPNPGQITGTVRDASTREPAMGATVVLVPEDKDLLQQSLFFRSVGTAPDGRFTVKNLRPGDYRVYAFEDIEHSAWLDPEYLKPFEARSEKISVREGGAQSLQVTLIPADTSW